MLLYPYKVDGKGKERGSFFGFKFVVKTGEDSHTMVLTSLIKL